MLQILATILIIQSHAPADTVHRIRESVITASAGKFEMASPDTVPSAILRSATGIADAIRFFSGVQIKDYGGAGGLKTVNVRSLGSEHTGVFIDNIEVTNAQNMQVDLGRFSTEDLSSIELFNGQKPGIFQTAKEYSAASSLYMTSGIPRFDKGKKDNYRIRVRGGSFGTFSPSFTAEHLSRNGVRMRMSSEFLSSSGKYEFKPQDYDTTMTRMNGDIMSIRAKGQAFGTVRNGEWQALAYYYSSERGLPGAVVRRTSAMPSSKDRQTDRNFFIQGKINRKLSDFQSLMLNGKYARDYLRYRTNPEEDPQALPYDNSYKQETGYLSASDLFAIKRWWNLNFATDFQYDCLDSDLQGFVFPRRYGFYAVMANHLSFKNINISASLLYTLASDKFKEGSASYAGGFAKNGKTREVLSPDITLAMRPIRNQEFTIRSFVKRSYRMPSFNDLYYTLVGNSNLDPEDAWQYDLSFDFRKGISSAWSLAAKADFYYNSVKDKIIAIPTSNQFRWTMFNIGKTEILGSETVLSIRHSGSIASGIMIKYTYQQARDRSNPSSASYNGQIPYIPLNSGSLNADVSFKGWAVLYSLLANGKRWSSAANIEDYEIDPWVTQDLAISKSVGNITLNLALNNLSNRQYQVVQGYPMPGFNLMASIGYDF